MSNILYAPFSYSKIGTYNQCAKKFWYTYISDIVIEKSRSLALERGSFVHYLLENYGSSITKLTEDFKFTYMTKEDVNSTIEQYNIFVDKFKNLVESPYLGIETKIGLTEKVQPCSYYSENALLRGAIDRLTINTDGTALIIDWKTGKLPFKDSNEQLMLYSIWVFGMFPEVNTVQVVYAYIDQLQTINYYFTRDNLNNYVNKFGQYIKTIISDNEFNKTESVLCKYCDYFNYCAK